MAKDPDKKFSSNWNPAKWVSENPNEFEVYKSLEDLKRGAAKSRVRSGVYTYCPNCNDYIKHDYDCDLCGAQLPCVPDSRTHNY